MSNIILPTPVTRKDHYKHYQVAGGDIADLPQPVTRDDCYEYAKCINGIVAGGTTVPGGVPDGAIPLPDGQQPTQNQRAYVKATLDSNSSGMNWFSGLFDLQSRPIQGNETVKVRFRFKMLNVDEGKFIGARLFVSQNNDRNTIKDDVKSVEFTNSTAVVKDKEYMLEASYKTTDVVTGKFLKPFISIGANGLSEVEVYEIKVIITGADGIFEEHDITNTVSDLDNKGAGKIETLYMDSFRPYADVVLNSGSGSVNYLSSVSNVGETILKKSATATAKAIFRFIIKDDSADKPVKVSAKLFADNEANATKPNLTGYIHDQDLIVNPVVGKEYCFEVEFPKQAKNFNLHDFSYLKPYLVFQKSRNEGEGRTLTHHIEVKEVSIRVNDFFITDITKLVGDFGVEAGSKSSIKYIETNPKPVTQPSTGGNTIYYVQPKLKYEGKVCTVIGDSNVRGLDANNINGIVSKSWADGLKDYCKFSKVNNLGISSSTLSDNPSIPGWQTARNPVVNRWVNIPQSDVIIFAIGINDFWLDVQLGEANLTNTNKVTFNGAFNVFIQGLIAKFPHAMIAGCTIVDYGKSPTHKTITLEQWNENIRNMCNLYSIPVIDFNKIAGFSCKVPAQQNLYMKDKLHYSQLGHTRLTQKSGDFINYQL